MKPKLKCDFNKEKLGFVIDKLNSLPEGDYIVCVFSKKQKRSIPQNRLLHMWFGIIAKEIGQSLDLTKEQFKRKLCPVDIPDPETGEMITIGKPTSVMSKEEMTGFIDSVFNFALDFLNIRLPLPEDLTFEQLTDEYL